MATIGELTRNAGRNAFMDAGVAKLFNPTAYLQGAFGAALDAYSADAFRARIQSVVEAGSAFNVVRSSTLDAADAIVGSTSASAAMVESLDPARTLRDLDPSRMFGSLEGPLINVLGLQRGSAEPAWLALTGADRLYRLPTALDAACHAFRAHPLITRDTAVCRISEALELPEALREVVRSTARSVAPRTGTFYNWPSPADLFEVYANLPSPVVEPVGDSDERDLALELLYGVVERAERIEQRQNDLDARLVRIEGRLSRSRDALDWSQILVSHIALAIGVAEMDPEVVRAVWDELTRVVRSFRP